MVMHEISRPGLGYAGNDSCPEISLCANITRPTLFEKVSNVTLAWKEQADEQAEEEDRDLVRRPANPCWSPPVDSYLKIVSEEQQQIRVNQAAPMSSIV